MSQGHDLHCDDAGCATCFPQVRSDQLTDDLQRVLDAQVSGSALTLLIKAALDAYNGDPDARGAFERLLSSEEIGRQHAGPLPGTGNGERGELSSL